MEKTPGRLRVNNIDFAISISGHGTPLIWGHGMMANTAAEAQAPWFAWDQLGDVVTVIRYDAHNSSSEFVSANSGRKIRERLKCVTETRLPQGRRTNQL